MIEITNGLQFFRVPNSAFETVFKGMGFRPVTKSDEQGESSDEHDEETADKKESSFDDELLEKPIGEWTKAELRRFAKEKGIDLTGKSPSEAKELIKEYLESEM